jgi:hypothetical protein
MAVRRIYCYPCGQQWPGLAPEDIANHWQSRTVPLIAQKPAEHFIKIDGVRSDLSSLICDHCGQPIPDGSPAVAYTAWRYGQEPRRWENDYQARTEPDTL